MRARERGIMVGGHPEWIQGEGPETRHGQRLQQCFGREGTDDPKKIQKKGIDMPPGKESRIAVVYGGPSAEAEVSRVSGRGVATALSVAFSHVVEMELDRNIGIRLREESIDVVFPVLHGPPGEDGTFQGFLEILELPYVGSGVRASACAMDKALAKGVFRSAALPVAPDMVVDRHLGKTEAAKRVINTLGTDVVIKPVAQGSALGVHFATTPDDIEKAIQEGFVYGEHVLVEQRINGKEITVAIFERDGGVKALPVIEVTTPQGSWYDFEHRYTPGLSEHIIPAPLPKAQYERTQEIAILAHLALGCRDLSRVDFVVPDGGNPIVLEVNTLPGMTPTSLFPDAARAAGISFEALVAHLIDLALKRKPGIE
jgi:D-alanine-D-alanine ligase